MHNLFNLGSFDLINLRLLLVLSPITVTFSWAMLIYGEFEAHYKSWRF